MSYNLEIKLLLNSGSHGDLNISKCILKGK